MYYEQVKSELGFESFDALRLLLYQILIVS